MKGRSVSIPIAMLTRNFYCHICGERLEKHPRKRTIQRGDPNYRKLSRIGHTHMIGSEIELTEYDFRCPACENIIGYDEQCVIRKIQRQLHKTALSNGEILDNREKAKETMGRNAKVRKVIFTVIALVAIGLIFYCQIKSGDFSFTFYF